MRGRLQMDDLRRSTVRQKRERLRKAAEAAAAGEDGTLKRGGSLLHSAYVFTPSNTQAAGLAHIRPSLHYLPVGDTTLACVHGLSI